LQAADIAGHNVGVDFRGLDIRVAKQFLKDADIDPIFQHVRGKTMAQCVATDFFIDSGLVRGPFYRFLQDGFKNVMAHDFAGARINGSLFSRKTHCHPVCFEALGYFLARASGI